MMPFLLTTCSSSTPTAQQFPCALKNVAVGAIIFIYLWQLHPCTLSISSYHWLSQVEMPLWPAKCALKRSFNLNTLILSWLAFPPVRNSWSKWREHQQLPNARALLSISRNSCWSVPFNNSQAGGNCHFSACCFWVDPWVEQLHAQGTTLLPPVLTHLIAFRLQTLFSCHLLICQSLKLTAPGLVLQTPV